MRFSTAGIVLSLAAAAFPAFSEEYDEDGRPLEYQRVCDVYGTGFFYIPGTETCLKISGYVRYEAVENPSRLGVGTVVRGGSERFVARTDEWLDSFGGGGGFEYGLGEGEGRLLGRGGAVYNQFVYGDANITGGNSSSSGSATNGVDGVSGIGLTFAEYDPAYLTGVGTGTAGFGVSGKAKIDYLGGEFELGYGQSYGAREDAAKPVFVWRGGLYYEGMSYGSDGFAEVTSGGVPYNGISQSYDYDSDDYYAGFKYTGEFYLRPADRLTVKVSGYVKVGYHWGEADFSQTTTVPDGNQVIQHYRYQDTGFVVGGGLAVNADYAIAPNWTIGAGYEFDIVPEVTAAYAPENPNEQPISFSGEAVKQHKVTIRVAASFN